MVRRMATKETCPKCGAVYEVTEVKVMFRDKDSYECDCGHVMASWNGSRYPQYHLIQRGKAPDAQGS